MPRAKYYNMAKALTDYMEEHNLTAPQFADYLGLENRTAVYAWLRGQFMPSEDMRKLIIEKTGLPETLFVRKPRSSAIVTARPPKRKEPRLNDPFLFSPNEEDGLTRITMDVSLPPKEALDVLKALLKAGLKLE